MLRPRDQQNDQARKRNNFWLLDSASLSPYPGQVLRVTINDCTTVDINLVTSLDNTLW